LNSDKSRKLGLGIGVALLIGAPNYGVAAPYFQAHVTSLCYQNIKQQDGTTRRAEQPFEGDGEGYDSGQAKEDAKRAAEQDAAGSNFADCEPQNISALPAPDPKEVAAAEKKAKEVAAKGIAMGKKEIALHGPIYGVVVEASKRTRNGVDCNRAYLCGKSAHMSAIDSDARKDVIKFFGIHYGGKPNSVKAVPAVQRYVTEKECQDALVPITQASCNGDSTDAPGSSTDTAGSANAD
jgi:hypothetical protein